MFTNTMLDIFPIISVLFVPKFDRRQKNFVNFPSEGSVQQLQIDLKLGQTTCFAWTGAEVFGGAFL